MNKVLHINSYYAAGKFYKHLFDEQVKQGIDISVYVPVPHTFNQASFDYGQFTTISRNHYKYDRLFFHVKHSKILEDIQKKLIINEYSVLHAHSLFSNGYIAVKLKEKYEIPYIVTVRNTDVNLFFRKMAVLRALGVKILKEASRVVFLSDSYREATLAYVPNSLKESIQSKTIIIPNGIDNFWFNNLNTEKRCLHEEEIKFFQVGEINKNKNYLATVEALEMLRINGLDARLNLAGQVKSQKIFKALISCDFVTYYGYLQKENLLELFHANDIFILPSIHETFGLVYAEAMSQGLPVIYTKGQGFDGQFEEGTVGYHVDPKDPLDIAEKIKMVLENYEHLSRNCLSSVGKFDWKRIAEQYESVYMDVLKQSSNS